MNKESWNTAICIFIISYTFFILAVVATLKFQVIDVEYIRAFAMWSTMTIGVAGLYVAIEKFGIDSKVYGTKKLACVYKKGGVHFGDIDVHVFDLINRSDNDIYLKNFYFSDGILKKYNGFHQDYMAQWDSESKEFIKKDNNPSGETNAIQPNESITIGLFLETDKSYNFLLKIGFTVDDFHGKELTLEKRIKQN